MDFDKEQAQQIIITRRFGRPSPTIIMVATIFCVIIALCALSFSGIGSSGHQRNARTEKVKATFSTKTPYKFQENLDTVVRKPAGCKAVQLNMVFRHGTRYPSANDIRKIDKMLEVLKSLKGEKDFEGQLRKFGIAPKNPYKVEVEKLLTTVGDKELYDIGKRYAKRFPELLEDTLEIQNFKFMSTCKARSSQSADAFAMGFLEGHGHLGEAKLQPMPLEINPCNKDEILRYFDMCAKYQKDVEDNTTATIEMDKFLNGTEVAKVVEKVKTKLKIQTASNLTALNVKMMYLMCAFSIAISNKHFTDGWCNVFDDDDFDVMEYVLDLKAYYKRSAAYKITYESSCPLLRDILHSVQAKAGRKVKYKAFKGIFRSSHAETLVPLYALMGLLLDERPLKADNYEEMKNREFRGGRIAPFAGNLAVVLYECAGKAQKIQLYNNERLLKFPCCKSEVDCPFEVFENCYQKISDACDFHAMCKVNATLSHDEL